jgi:GNAT superfamily N-acetyltransferase
MTITLRPAEATDVEAVAAIWYSGWYDGHLGNVPDELVAHRTKEHFLTGVPDRIPTITVAVAAPAAPDPAGGGAAPPDSAGADQPDADAASGSLGASVDSGGEVAGFVIVLGDQVDQVYVSSDHRGSGVAGVLIAEAERQVKANGHDEAWLAVATGNARARRFYERSGWTDAGAFDYPVGTESGTIPVPCHRYTKQV